MLHLNWRKKDVQHFLKEFSLSDSLQFCAQRLTITNILFLLLFLFVFLCVVCDFYLPFMYGLRFTILLVMRLDRYKVYSECQLDTFFFLLCLRGHSSFLAQQVRQGNVSSDVV